jgi:predicted amidohydrolase
MIVALCPLDNAFDTAANLAAIDRQLAEAARGCATLAVFPECGLTGFKARKDLTHAHLADALAQTQRLAARHGVATLMPSIELDHSGRPRNRARLFAADGMLRACFEKHHLTPSEQRWFAASDAPRRRWFDLDDHRFGVVFCVELQDAPDAHIDVAVDAVLWPAYWGHGEPMDWASEGPFCANATMRDRARVWNAPLLLVNTRRTETDTPTPESKTTLGGSLAVAPDGTLLHAFEPRRLAPLLIALPPQQSL